MPGAQRNSGRPRLQHGPIVVGNLPHEGCQVCELVEALGSTVAQLGGAIIILEAVLERDYAGSRPERIEQELHHARVQYRDARAVVAKAGGHRTLVDGASR